MKHVLVLGAGQSSPFLIKDLLERAAANDWSITVADIDEAQAARRVAGHARGRAVALNVQNEGQRDALIKAADLACYLLPPPLQPPIAEACVRHGTHLVSASYRPEALRQLDTSARAADVLLLSEMGLDPGIDLMSAADLIAQIRARGGKVTRFISYGSGIPAPDVPPNALRYCITWNPRNVALAGEAGAQYLREGAIKIVPWAQVFAQTWPVEVDGVGPLEAYANRDALGYLKYFGLDHCQTMIRATLRYPGFCETWQQIVRLGLPNEHLHVPDLARRSYAELVEMFLPDDGRAASGDSLAQRVARYLGVNPTGSVLQKLRALGLFDTQPCGAPGDTPAQALIHLLKTRLPLPSDARDMVILLHEMDVAYDGATAHSGRRERIVSTLVHLGQPGGITAMAQTVGAPMAVAARLILGGKLTVRGSHIPTDEQIYRPVLAELQQLGLAFEERTTPLA